jgi:hypothetical protein
MIRLTQSSCTAVSTELSFSEETAEMKVMRTAVTLTESWNWRNFLTESLTAAPHDSDDNVGKRVVHKDNVRRLLGNLGTGNAHGETNVGELECRTVVGTVASDTDNLAHRLEGLDEKLLVLGRRTGKDLKAGRDFRRSASESFL